MFKIKFCWLNIFSLFPIDELHSLRGLSSLVFLSLELYSKIISHVFITIGHGALVLEIIANSLYIL